MFTRLACIALILALGMVGSALAENAVDEARVDNGTMDLETVIHGFYFLSDQSVSGVGLVAGYTYYDAPSSDGTPAIALKAFSSGTGSYSHNSSTIVRNNVVNTKTGDFASSNQRITSKDEVSAVYAPTTIKFPGSFVTKSIKSLWRDQTYSRNFVGVISMDALFDYARTLNKDTNTVLSSDSVSFPAFIGAKNSTVTSSMDVNSNFEGSAHLGATLSDKNNGMKGFKGAKANDTILMDEDYRGSFALTKKMAVNIKKTTNYGYYEANYDGSNGDYPWLPCSCNQGWNDMVIHDQRYHSAKGFFDCKSCPFPYCS